MLSLYDKELTSLLGSEKYRIGSGNLNTFINAAQDVVRSTLRSFLNEYDDGISISLGDTGVQASRIIAENEFAGITKVANIPLQPIFKKILDENDILLNFEKLIYSDAKESQLEEFIHQYYHLAGSMIRFRLNYG